MNKMNKTKPSAVRIEVVINDMTFVSTRVRCDTVDAASKRYAVVAAKANGFETASKAYELNTQMEQK